MPGLQYLTDKATYPTSAVQMPGTPGLLVKNTNKGGDKGEKPSYLRQRLSAFYVVSAGIEPKS